MLALLTAHTAPKILIPGAGLGRLAYEDFNKLPNATVELNEFSIPMATALSRIIHNGLTVEIFSHVQSSATVGEVSSKNRLQKVQVSVLPLPQNSQLSLTTGDFVTCYSTPLNTNNAYDYILTSYILDAVPNIIEMILIIKKLALNSRSQNIKTAWCNYGPLHWHNGVELKLSVDEIKDILTKEGFVIDEWEIVVGEAYRNDVDEAMFMTDELYNCLKFCVTLDDSKEFEDDIISRIEEGRRQIKEKKDLEIVNANEDDPEEEEESTMRIEEL